MRFVIYIVVWYSLHLCNGFSESMGSDWASITSAILCEI